LFIRFPSTEKSQNVAARPSTTGLCPMPTEKLNEPLSDDLLWGVDAIAAFIGVPLRKAYYLIDAGKIPVRKFGHRTITASRVELRRLFAPEAA
jgi:hypothetical protein